MTVNSLAHFNVKIWLCWVDCLESIINAAASVSGESHFVVVLRRAENFSKRRSKFCLFCPNHGLIQWMPLESKVYECCFMRQNCHFQNSVLQCKNATKPLRFSGIHNTRTFKRGI